MSAKNESAEREVRRGVNSSLFWAGYAGGAAGTPEAEVAVLRRIIRALEQRAGECERAAGLALAGEERADAEA